MRDHTEQLNKALAAYAIPGIVVHRVCGPRVVSYHVKVSPGFRVHKLLRVSTEIALSLSTASVRIYPRTSDGVIAIDVPRTDPVQVSFEDCALQTAWHYPRHLPIMFGLDSAGQPVAGDLVEMPHLLIAGATGSGKSVALNAILCGLASKKTPEEMRFVLLDPKGVELTMYSRLRHTTTTAVSPQEASIALQNLEETMDQRYRMLKNSFCRNITDYNTAQATAATRLPYIVVVVDELADLVLSESGSFIETSLIRLAQKARAAGIHIIAATQRPVVKVVTGLIKVNFPTRLALRVPSQIDSKTILDQPGAERLLGSGDALLLYPGKDLLRVQGPWVSDEVLSLILRLNQRAS